MVASFVAMRVSAFVPPDDAPYLRLLAACARVRHRHGLPALTTAELAALLEPELRERRAPLPPNVLHFPAAGARRREGDR